MMSNTLLPSWRDTSCRRNSKKVAPLNTDANRIVNLVVSRAPLERLLYRETELVQQPGDVVIANPEPPAAQVADPGGGPDAAGVARRLWSLLDQPGELLVSHRQFRLNRLARSGRRLLDPDPSHDRLLETDRRNLCPPRSRRNLIDAGGSGLPNELTINT